ncbi:3-oxoacyl-[acyl-carrier-protein] reductase [Candidatus Woesearchaeota archaeon]|nr:3-oxoacyl-[acyl-carrier-protein] reductase [Candidatus Woesearchaeota archaeon]
MKDKNALVTGATRGIGRAIVMALAKEGCNIAFNYSGDDVLAKEVADSLKALGVKVVYGKADVSDYSKVVEFVGIVRENFRSLDIIVNNAGITRDRTLRNMSCEEWQRVIDVNLNGVFNVTKACMDLLRDNGRIINISSIVGEFGNFGQTNYAAAKAGIVGFTKSLAKELGKRNITVNAVAPGFIRTEMTRGIPFIRKLIIGKLIPLKDLGEAEDIANAVVFLASDKARYITGEVLHVSGGLSF